MSQKNSLFKIESIIYTLLILGILIAVNFLVSKNFRRLDFTENKMYTISEPTKKLLTQLDDIVTIKVFFSKNLPAHVKKAEQDTKDLISEFLNYSNGNVTVQYIDPTDNIDYKKEANALGIPELLATTIEKDKDQRIKVYMGIAVIYGDKKEIIPVVQNITNLEYDLAQKISKVYRQITPKIGIIKTDTMPYFNMAMRQQMRGQLPNDPTEEKYAPIFNALKENYDVVTLDISKGDPIDPSIKTVIVPGGDVGAFSDADLLVIDQYFIKGGNLIVLADAIKIEMKRGVSATENRTKLTNMLRNYGVNVTSDLVLDVQCGQVQVPKQVGPFKMNVPMDYPYFPVIAGDGFNKDNSAVATLARMQFTWVSPIGFLNDTSSVSEHTALASSTKQSWVESGKFNLNPDRKWAEIANSKQDNAKSYTLASYSHGTFNSAFKALKEMDSTSDIVTKGDNLNLIVTGDSEFLSAQQATPDNIAWLLNVVDWLTLDENLISIRSRALVDRTIKYDNIDDKDQKNYSNLIRLFNILFAPILLIGIGIFLYYIRREQKKK